MGETLFRDTGANLGDINTPISHKSGPLLHASVSCMIISAIPIDPASSSVEMDN